LARVGDDSLLAELIGLFVEDVPNRLAAVEQSLASANPAGVCRSAHYLKGALALFDARPADIAGRLEQMGRSSDLTRANETFSKLQQETRRLVSALTAPS
jgi:protein-histidine pros-kinase